MIFRTANTIANIKMGLQTNRLSVRAYPNNFTKRILRKLTEEGIIRGFSIDTENKNMIKISLKYDEHFKPVIKDIKLISTSGKRKYLKYREILEAHARGEVYILSTTKGLFTVDEIVYNNLQIGGEAIVRIYYY